MAGLRILKPQSVVETRHLIFRFPDAPFAQRFVEQVLVVAEAERTSAFRTLVVAVGNGYSTGRAVAERVETGPAIGRVPEIEAGAVTNGAGGVGFDTLTIRSFLPLGSDRWLRGCSLLDTAGTLASPIIPDKSITYPTSDR